MPLYRVPVITTEMHGCDYTVEADSLEAAIQKALAGDTKDEEYTTVMGVMSRKLDPEDQAHEINPGSSDD